MKMNKKLFAVLLGVSLIGLACISCATVSSKQWGESGSDTIGFNLTPTNIGNLYVTSVNGEPTGAKAPGDVLGLGIGSEGVYITPCM